MNNNILSIFAFVILGTSGYLIMRFFDIGLVYYIPFLSWFAGLVIFYNVLSDEHENIFLKELN